GRSAPAPSPALASRAWRTSSCQRVSGLSLTDVDLFNWPAAESAPGNVVLASVADRRARQLLPRVYSDPTSGAFEGKPATEVPSTTSPLTYTGHEAVAADIRYLKSALREGEQGFITAIAPGSAARIWNEHYESDDDHLQAWA